MHTIRFFDSGRRSGQRSVASEIMRIEIMKKGKMPSADRFKHIFKQRMADNKKKLLGGKTIGFKLPGSLKAAGHMSKRAEQALKEVAQKKAAKEAKALRQMVIVQPKVYSNGKLVRDGRVYDIAGNTIARVNNKNGKIMLSLGFGGTLGRYKPNSFATHTVIQGAIDKYSPYYINLRKMQAMQGGQGYGVWGAPDVIDVPARSANSDNYGYHGGDMFAGYGSNPEGPRQNVGATAWGAMSDNAWGTFADNVWGTSMDTVWGTNMSDVWGGIGGNPYGKSVQFWGTGNGRNYIKGLASRVAAFFGLSMKSQASRAAFHEAVNAVRSRNGAHEHGPVRSSSAAHDHGPVRSAAVEHAPVTRAPTTRH